jgi:multicomponent Na+:H+ antiporter subunit D
MTELVPLAVAVPLLAAAVFTAIGAWTPPPVLDVAAAAVAAAETGICLTLLVHSWHHDLIHWFSGWEVRDGVALGISFTVTPTGAALASAAGLIATGALVFSWSSFRGREVAHVSYTLLLLFMTGMVGFALTGDLFNMFVFFELMSVAGYALTGYQVRQPSVLQGALNFAITNSIAGFLILFGIGLLYGRTSALNLAQIGEALARGPADSLVVVALALIVVGFLVKGGSVPFHFWLSDAYAVAPAQVGALLTGILSDLALHAVAKVYWTAFSGATGAAPAVQALLVGVGAASALVGGATAILQADLKRLVAFATVANGGITVVGIGVLSAGGLAGSTVLVVAAGLVRAAAILACGVCVHRLGASDEQLLHGRGRSRRYAPLGIAFALCTLGLAAVPPFGPFLGKALVEQAATAAGFGWIPAVLTVSTALVAAGLLRATARVFLGLGPARDPLLAEQPDEPQEGESEETGDEPSQIPFLVPVYVFLVAALGVAFVPGIAGRALQAAERELDRPAYAAEVLHGHVPPPPGPPPHVSLPDSAYAYGAASGAAAIVLGLVVLYRRRLPGAVRTAAAPLGRVAAGLHALHNGTIGDYVAWLAVGAATIAVAWVVTLT